MEVLADAQGEAVYPLSAEELAHQVEQRVRAIATACGVRLRVEIQTDTVMSSRVANLMGLVLVNLVENALQATPAGKSVSLRLREAEGLLTFSVQDEGPGFPRHLRHRLFLPCKSTREGGSGIGLSICKQIADHLGASLELTDPPEGGCQFTLSLMVTHPDDSPVAVWDRGLSTG